MFVEKFLLLFFPCEAHTNYTPPMCPQSECYLVVYSGHYNLTGRVFPLRRLAGQIPGMKDRSCAHGDVMWAWPTWTGSCMQWAGTTVINISTQLNATTPRRGCGSTCSQ